MNDREWIKELKVGDRVVTSSRHGKSTTTVSRITSKGSIKTENGFSFNQDGSRKGSDTWNPISLLQLTDDLLLEFKKGKLVSQCKAIKFEELDTDQLQRILYIRGE